MATGQPLMTPTQTRGRRRVLTNRWVRKVGCKRLRRRQRRDRRWCFGERFEGSKMIGGVGEAIRKNWRLYGRWMSRIQVVTFVHGVSIDHETVRRVAERGIIVCAIHFRVHKPSGRQVSGGEETRGGGHGRYIRGRCIHGGGHKRRRRRVRLVRAGRVEVEGAKKLFDTLKGLC